MGRGRLSAWLVPLLAATCTAHDREPLDEARAPLTVSPPVQITTASARVGLGSNGSSALAAWSDGTSTLGLRLDASGTPTDAAPFEIGPAPMGNPQVSSDGTDFLVLVDGLAVKVDATSASPVVGSVSLPFSSGNLTFDPTTHRWQVLSGNGQYVARIEPSPLALAITTTLSTPSFFVEDFVCSTTQCVFGGTLWNPTHTVSHRNIYNLDGLTVFSQSFDEWNKLRLAASPSGGLLWVDDYGASYLEPPLAGSAGVAASDHDAAGGPDVYLFCATTAAGELAAVWADRAPFVQPHPSTFTSDAMVPATPEVETGPAAVTFTDDTGLCGYRTPAGIFVRRITLKPLAAACTYDFECDSHHCTLDGGSWVCSPSGTTSVSSAGGTGGAGTGGAGGAASGVTTSTAVTASSGSASASSSSASSTSSSASAVSSSSTSAVVSSSSSSDAVSASASSDASSAVSSAASGSASTASSTSSNSTGSSTAASTSSDDAASANASSAISSASGGQGGAGGNGPVHIDRGCALAATPSEPAPSAAWLLVLLAPWWRRRKRSARAKPSRPRRGDGHSTATP